MGLLKRKKISTDKAEKQIEEEKPAVETTDIKSLGAAKYNYLIIRPIVTEKSAVAQSQNKYSFIVDKRANKSEIKIAIKEIFGVLPLSVNLINVEGKIRRFGRVKGRRQDYKKAIVTLPKGKTISVHEGV